MGFVGEASERLERSHSLIYGLFEIAAQQRPVDIAFESFYDGIGGGSGNELDVEAEAGRRQQPRQGVECGAGLPTLDPRDDGLGGSCSSGELSLSEGGPHSSFSKERHPIVDTVHAIMIFN
jgi:hypothetical protein